MIKQDVGYVTRHATSRFAERFPWFADLTRWEQVRILLLYNLEAEPLNKEQAAAVKHRSQKYLGYRHMYSPSLGAILVWCEGNGDEGDRGALKTVLSVAQIPGFPMTKEQHRRYCRARRFDKIVWKGENVVTAVEILRTLRRLSDVEDENQEPVVRPEIVGMAVTWMASFAHLLKAGAMSVMPDEEGGCILELKEKEKKIVLDFLDYNRYKWVKFQGGSEVETGEEYALDFDRNVNFVYWLYGV